MGILNHIWYWIEIHTGTLNEPGPYYGFFSGFGSDLGELALVGGLSGLYVHHVCHVSGCCRPGKHPVDGTPYKVCAKHHPDVPDKVTHEHVLKAHEKAKSF